MRAFLLRFMAASVALLVTFGASAGDIAVGNVIVENPWSRATPKGAKVGAGYFGLINIGDKADKLIGAMSDLSERVEIHSMKIDNGVMKMRHVDGGLEIGPKSALTFKPGGYHLMFIGLKQPLVKGQDFNVTLTFEKAGQVDVLFLTSGIGGKSPYPAESHGGSASGSASGAAVQGSQSGTAAKGSKSN